MARSSRSCDSGGRVYLKGKGDVRGELEAAGRVQWVETMKSRKVSHMPYWTLPDDALDDPDTGLRLGAPLASLTGPSHSLTPTAA
jgi:hypothetical protein